MQTCALSLWIGFFVEIFTNTVRKEQVSIFRDIYIDSTLHSTLKKLYYSGCRSYSLQVPPSDSGCGWVFWLKSIMLFLGALCHLLCHVVPFLLCHKVIISLTLSELSEVTNGVSFEKVTDGYKRRTRRCRRAHSMSG